MRRGLLDAWLDLIFFLVSVIGLTGSDDSYSSEGHASEALSLDEQGGVQTWVVWSVGFGWLVDQRAGCWLVA